MADTVSLLSVLATTLNKWGNDGEAWDEITRQNGLLYYFRKFGRAPGLGQLDSNTDGKRAEGGINRLDGGAQIEEIVSLLENTNGGFISDETSVDHDVQNPIRSALFQWKMAIVNATLSKSMLLKNSGTENQKIDLKNALIDNAKATLTNLIGSALWQTTDASSIDGIPLLITDNGVTTGATAVGGLETTTYPLWKNKFIDMDATVAAVTNDVLFTKTSQILRQCTVGGTKPDVIVCGDALYARYELMLADRKRIMQSDAAKELGKAGFDAIAWTEGTTILYDVNCPADRAYVLNTEYLKFNVHKDADFTVGEVKEDPYAPIYNFPITFFGNFSVRRRNAQGVILFDSAS